MKMYKIMEYDKDHWRTTDLFLVIAGGLFIAFLISTVLNNIIT